MHQCEEFRERISEFIIDRKDLTRKPEIHSELVLCQSCSDFYAESREMMEALSSVEFDLPETQWDGMTQRLRTRILAESAETAKPASASSTWKFRLPSRRSNWLGWEVGVPALAALAAVMLITVGLYSIVVPMVEQSTPATVAGDPQILPDADNLLLDPVTVDFLEQSELLLRNVMKLEAADTEDLQETQLLAVQHLLRIDQRMEAASGAPPVQTVMGKYETILRDIRNLSQRTVAEDILDIQKRIERNGLIAEIKGFQPPATVADVVAEQ